MASYPYLAAVFAQPAEASLGNDSGRQIGAGVVPLLNWPPPTAQPWTLPEETMRSARPPRLLASTASDPSLHCAPNRLRISLDTRADLTSNPQPHPGTGPSQPASTGSVANPPSPLSAGGIQSPYIHRASGLLQIAVSTRSAPTATSTAESQPAEHCRYGTRDLSLIETQTWPPSSITISRRQTSFSEDRLSWKLTFTILSEGRCLEQVLMATCEGS